ncbi:MAG: YqhA family protein [Agrobacterium tumefaciens]|nr:YqhA family protein [Agrobacterium tumefaciens]
MLSFLLSLRYVMGLASIGVIAASFLMFWEGLLAIGNAFVQMRVNPDQAIVAAVLQGVDKLLFAIVLVIFGCAITVGFVASPTAHWRAQLPRWMLIEDVAELKNLFFQMIILYLVVHFVTLVAELEEMPDWNALVLPVSILLLAAAMKIIATASTHRSSGDVEATKGEGSSLGRGK